MWPHVISLDSHVTSWSLLIVMWPHVISLDSHVTSCDLSWQSCDLMWSLLTVMWPLWRSFTLLCNIVSRQWANSCGGAGRVERSHRTGAGQKQNKSKSPCVNCDQRTPYLHFYSNCHPQSLQEDSLSSLYKLRELHLEENRYLLHLFVVHFSERK